ncbi:MAG: bifunctional diguanylate cyclase/phosphodiesterase [Bacteroidales bacterium]|nr:bifunctional diguanylate cyclase/phosphodiesterase [Clostridium sp.]MCM1202683.1 bifunctional diguanylate cyclase/phosphodiesterase [Bacteroidales bacterium]
MYYNVDYEICALVFLMLLIIISSAQRRLEGFQSKIFRLYLTACFGNICLDIITCYTVSYYQMVPLWLNYLLNTVFLMMQCLIPTMLVMYIYFRGQRVTEGRQQLLGMAWIPAIFGALLVLSSLWTGWVFYFDETGYHHGILHSYLYVNALLYSVGTILYTVIRRKTLKEKQCALIIMMVVISLIPNLVQYVFPHYMLSGVGTGLSIFIIYLTGENMIVYVDSLTGALNREAFTIHIQETAKRGNPEQIFVIALDNFKLINEIYGMTGGNNLMQQLVAALQKEYSASRVFRFGGDVFCVAISEKTESIKELDSIRRILRRAWKFYDAEIEISACICLMHTIHHNGEDLIQAIEYAISKAKFIGKGQFFEVDEEAVSEMVRQKAIEQAMVAAIEEGKFEVHYQPIYDTRHKRFHSMEALARLNVPEYGYVSPEEFIRIAEQNGKIIQIGMLVLEEVCRFIKQYDLKRRGIEFVEVNLSVVQCMQEKIYIDIKEMLDKYGIPAEMLNLEITESAAAYSEERLIQNMARLSLMDIQFSLDDYGSGYSNVNYLVDLPFSIVKLDKYIVWAAMKKVTSRMVLENTIAMFKDINLKVVAEGIEDLEMAEIITAMGADYLQGYYYSKPVPKEKLIDCLEEGYLETL